MSSCWTRIDVVLLERNRNPGGRGRRPNMADYPPTFPRTFADFTNFAKLGLCLSQGHGHGQGHGLQNF